MVGCRGPSTEGREDKEGKEHMGRMCTPEHCICLQFWDHRADTEGNREGMDVEYLV